MPRRGLPVDGIHLTIDGRAANAVLPAASGTLDAAGDVSAVFLRQEEPEAVFTAVLQTAPPSGRAGVSAYAGTRHHHDLTVTPVDGDRLGTLRRRVGDLEQVSQARLAGAGPTRLRVRSTTTHYRFEAGDVADDPAHGADACCLGEAEMTTWSAETAEEFCGGAVRALLGAHRRPLSERGPRVGAHGRRRVGPSAWGEGMSRVCFLLHVRVDRVAE